jgi:hypothetical protein
MTQDVRNPARAILILELCSCKHWLPYERQYRLSAYIMLLRIANSEKMEREIESPVERNTIASWNSCNMLGVNREVKKAIPVTDREVVRRRSSHYF